MTKAPYDASAFRQFELEGWERLSDGYHLHWEELTTQAIPCLLSGTNVDRSSHLLDVACGPGYVAGAAAARGASTVGIDFSPNMIALAGTIFSELEFQVADAEDLPFGDESFDAALINFGILHFPNPESALTEIYRVLEPGGRLAFTNWAKADDSAITIAMRAIAKEGSLEVDLPPGTPLYRFADPDECQSVLSGIGFKNVTCEKLNLNWRLPRVDALMDTFSLATARMSGLLAAQKPGNLPAIRSAMTEGCARYDQGDVTVLSMPALLTIATKA